MSAYFVVPVLSGRTWKRSHSVLSEQQEELRSSNKQLEAVMDVLDCFVK